MDNVTLAYVLIACGILLMIAEMLNPTGGIMYVLGGGLVVIGAAMTIYYGDAYLGLATLLGVMILVPGITFGMFYLFPKTAMGDRLEPPSEESTVAQMPGVQGLEQYKGRVGKTTSTLRPSGIVDFDGKRIDCISEGMMIDADQWVRCIEVKTGRVIVRRIETPTATKFENTEFG